MNPTWHTTDRLPKAEPDDTNQAAYCAPQLLAGASADGRFIFDAVYDAAAPRFVLTLMEINTAFGFIEHEKRLYPASRAELLAAVSAFQAAPAQAFTAASE